jgi:hypothetical protein
VKAEVSKGAAGPLNSPTASSRRSLDRLAAGRASRRGQQSQGPNPFWRLAAVPSPLRHSDAVSNESPNAAQPELPSRLEISLCLGDEPLPGGWVLVGLPMSRKNSYRLLFGPTNTVGLVVVTSQDLSGGAQEINNLFLMDYVGLGPEWSGEVLLRPVTLPAIEHLRVGFATWRHTGLYPGDFAEQMDSLEERLSAVAPNTMIQLSLLADPGGNADIKISSLPVIEPKNGSLSQ